MVCRRQRQFAREKRDVHQRVPVVALTAHAMKGDRERFLRAGMDGYVSKPIDPRQLAEVIHRLTVASGGSREIDRTDEASDDAPLRDSQSLESRLAGVIDLEYARRRIPGGDHALLELAQLLCEEAPRLLQAIQQALADGDSTRLRREAHTLSGSAGVFAAKDVVQAARRLEQLAVEGKLDESRPVVDQLSTTVERLTTAFNQVTSRQRT